LDLKTSQKTISDMEGSQNRGLRWDRLRQSWVSRQCLETIIVLRQCLAGIKSSWGLKDHRASHSMAKPRLALTFCAFLRNSKTSASKSVMSHAPLAGSNASSLLAATSFLSPFAMRCPAFRFAPALMLSGRRFHRSLLPVTKNGIRANSTSFPFNICQKL